MKKVFERFYSVAIITLISGRKKSGKKICEFLEMHTSIVQLSMSFLGQKSNLQSTIITLMSWMR